MKYAILLLSLIAISSTIYAFSIETNPEKIIEEKNREKILDCLDGIQSMTWAKEMKKKINFCQSLPLLQIWTASGAIVPPPPKWYTSKHSLVLTGSHDYRVYLDRNWAVWRNNNPSWITWWVSNTLKWLWNESWIDYKKWTLRPAREWWNYVLFSTIEHWLRAKIISIRERWWKATVAHFLSWWWTDYVKLSFDTNKKISELSEWEFAELFIQQLKKESPGLISQLVSDWILIIN